MRPYYKAPDVTFYLGDVRDVLVGLPDESVHLVCTSPPYYGLRRYLPVGHPDEAKQIGLESSLDEYVVTMVDVFRAVRRVLRSDATLWLNLGSSYQNKQETLMPFRVALALQADGWWVRSVITWAKKASMPEPVIDRPTSATEWIFLLAKSGTYYYDQEAVRQPAADSVVARGAYGYKVGGQKHASERNDGDMAQRCTYDRFVGGANLRNFWLLGPAPFTGAHFAVFNPEIPRRAILAGTSEAGCCSACGAPWRRGGERGKYMPEILAAGMRNVDMSRGDKVRRLSGAEYNKQATLISTSWRPTCTCNAPTEPSTVLDPFLGSGTTALVARQLGRQSIGIDLNESYLEMARDRLEGQTPMLPLAPEPVTSIECQDTLAMLLEGE